MYGTRFFNKLTYEIRSIDNGDELIIKADEAPQALLMPAIHYDTENGAGLILSYLHRNLLMLNSRLALEVDLAENSRIFLNYLKYLGREQQFAAIIGADFILSDYPSGFGIVSNRASTVYRSSYLNPYVRIQTTSFQNWMVGVSAGLVTASLKPVVTTREEIADSIIVDLDNVKRFPYNSYRLGVYAQLNTLNQQVFPSSGWLVDFNFERITGVNIRPKFFNSPSLGGEILDLAFSLFENTSRASLEVQNYYLLTNRWNLQTELFATYTRNELLTPYDNFQVGGFYPLLPRSISFWGSNTYEFSVKESLIVRERAGFQLVKNLYAEAVVNALFYEDNSLAETEDSIDTIFGYGIGIKYRSILGPVQLALSHQANSNIWHGFLRIGFNI